MTKEQAEKILHQCGNLAEYNVEIIPHCYEYIVMISHKDMFKASMFLVPKLVAICAEHNNGIVIRTNGDGQEYMRIVLT